ncbi:uroporphyrinogen-III synthase [Hyphococcus sp.]|uniref:uroporphyrinogen-III synthase n=1 Tax=Hyphococcus sp. TaxID=2038636 RepID=UPI0035C69614
MTTVLVTRAEPDAGDFAELCRTRGLVPVLSSVMRIEIEKAAVDLAGVGALAFTSANGVRAFGANSTERSLPVYAVGPVTAEAAKAAGFQQVTAAGGDVAALADCIASESGFGGKAILHVAGADRAGDLVTMLKHKGIAARRQTLYQAKAEEALPPAAAETLKGEPGLWVTLFSPRTARLFLDLSEKAGLAPQLIRARAVCLSDAVAQAAREGAGWADIIVAQDRNAQSMIETICAAKPRA